MIGVMRNLICCLFLIAGGLTAQSSLLAAQSSSEDEADRAAVAKLDSILLTLHRDANASVVSRQLADCILSLAESYHNPARATVLRFAEELAYGLAWRELPMKLVSQLSASIVEVLESAGVGTYRFKESVARAKQALISLGLPNWKAQGIAERLRMVGKEVRGPDDMPLERFLGRPR